MPQINQTLESMARQTPDQIAVIDRGTPVSYAALGSCVRRAAAWLQRAGGIADDEMFRAFNMGVGLVVVVSDAQADEALALLAASGEQPWRLGRVD